MEQENVVEEHATENSVSAVSISKKRSFSWPLSRIGLFPVFSWPSKTIHLIRHGHTNYWDGPLRTKSGKHAFDVTLSSHGIEQASALRERMFCLGAEVILTSPLTRALQTLKAAVDLTQIPGGAKIEVTHLHTEHVRNSGDVGRPISMLSREFPMLSFTGLEEVWWFSPKSAPNDPIKGIFQSGETMDHLRKRVFIFCQHLLSRPETTIAVIGHSTFFRELNRIHKRMENCGILTIRVSRSTCKEIFCHLFHIAHQTKE